MSYKKKTLKSLYETKEYEDFVVGIKIFDQTINDIFYKDSEKKFELISFILSFICFK